ncbi:MAG TPA: phage portal protein [Chloroflexia bacterium]|nr:phage portal protein [Chloroflexia bacterium]
MNVNEEWTDYDFSITINGNPVASGLNPYGFIPYVVFPNISRPRQFWGQSDLEDIMSLNSELNVRVSVLSQLLQMSGNPVLVLENVDSAEGLRVGPGAVWTLPEGSKAYLLEMLKEGGVALHKEYINLLYRILHDLAEMPASGFGRDQATSASSGVAIEQLLYPVVQRVNRKRRVWDEALDMRNRMILALASLPVHRSRFVWPDIMPKDRSGLVTQEVGLVAAGIHSLDTARRNLGDEQPELEDDLILAERARLGGGATSGSNKPGLEMPVKLSGALVEGLSNSGG